MRQEPFQLLDKIRFNQQLKRKPESHLSLRERLVLRGWDEQVATEFVNQLYGKSESNMV